MKIMITVDHKGRVTSVDTDSPTEDLRVYVIREGGVKNWRCSNGEKVSVFRAIPHQNREKLESFEQGALYFEGVSYRGGELVTEHMKKEGAEDYELLQLPFVGEWFELLQEDFEEYAFNLGCELPSGSSTEENKEKAEKFILENFCFAKKTPWGSIIIAS